MKCKKIILSIPRTLLCLVFCQFVMGCSVLNAQTCSNNIISGITPQTQLNRNLCWAASIAMVTSYLNAQSSCPTNPTVTQCDIIGNSSSCQSLCRDCILKTSSSCLGTSTPSQIQTKLSTLGYHSTINSPGFAKLIGQICANKPLIVRIKPRNGVLKNVNHWIVVNGVWNNANREFRFIDPYDVDDCDAIQGTTRYSNSGAYNFTGGILMDNIAKICPTIRKTSSTTSSVSQEASSLLQATPQSLSEFLSGLRNDGGYRTFLNIQELDPTKYVEVSSMELSSRETFNTLLQKLKVQGSKSLQHYYIPLGQGKQTRIIFQKNPKGGGYTYSGTETNVNNDYLNGVLQQFPQAKLIKLRPYNFIGYVQDGKPQFVCTSAITIVNKKNTIYSLEKGKPMDVEQFLNVTKLIAGAQKGRTQDIKRQLNSYHR